MKPKDFEALLPNGAIHFVKSWVGKENLTIKTRNTRKTKLGDYKFFIHENSHEITVNKDISPEAFFFVLTHEIAHLWVSIHYPKSVKSHGAEWKQVFGKLLLESLEIYPEALRPVILRHARSPKASLNADRLLHKDLFLNGEENDMRIENLSENQKFRLGKRVFEKGEKRKIRYLCREIRTGKLYVVSGSAIADEIF